MASSRLFIAIKSDSELTLELLRLQGLFQTFHGEGLRLVPADQLHLTAQFLGDVEDERIEEVQLALEESTRDRTAIAVPLDKLGCFPLRGAPRVLWLGCREPHEKLSQLIENLKENLQSIGFEPEDREFHAHVTLARVKDPKLERSLQAILKHEKARPSNLNIRELVLFKSELSQARARHTEVSRHRLILPAS